MRNIAVALLAGAFIALGTASASEQSAQEHYRICTRGTGQFTPKQRFEVIELVEQLATDPRPDRRSS